MMGPKWKSTKLREREGGKEVWSKCMAGILWESEERVKLECIVGSNWDLGAMSLDILSNWMLG